MIDVDEGSGSGVEAGVQVNSSCTVDFVLRMILNIGEWNLWIQSKVSNGQFLSAYAWPYGKLFAFYRES